MMTEEEKRKFLRKMGYNTRLLDPDPASKKKSITHNGKKIEWAPESHEDAQLLLKLNKAFNGEKEDGKRENND